MCSFEDVDVNTADYSGMTPLHLCARRGKFEYVKILLNCKKIKLNPKDIDGIFLFNVFFNRTPLEMARMICQNEMADFLEKIYRENNLLDDK